MVEPLEFPSCDPASSVHEPVSKAATHAEFHGTLSLSPEIPKPCWRQFRVSHCVLDIPVAEVSLQGSGVVPLVGERVAAGVPKHVRMCLEAKTRLAPSPLDHAGEPCGAEGCSSLRSEHEGRFRLLLALEAP